MTLYHMARGRCVWVRRTLREAAYERCFGRLEPKVFVIGAQKGGTTSLYMYLSMHPDLARSNRKEINFFNCDIYWDLGLRRYKKEFPFDLPGNSARWTMDISPGYMLDSDKVAHRIQLVYPDAKIIALLREPVQRAYSAWIMYRGLYRKNSNWYIELQTRCNGQAVAEREVRRSRTFGKDFIADCLDDLDAASRRARIEMPIIEFGLYEKQLAEFYKRFPTNQILVLEAEEFWAKPVVALRTIEGFLGIRHHDWTQENLAPHFQGDYEQKLPSQNMAELNELYVAANAGLAKLTGRSFFWA